MRRRVLLSPSVILFSAVPLLDDMTDPLVNLRISISQTWPITTWQHRHAYGFVKGILRCDIIRSVVAVYGPSSGRLISLLSLREAGGG